MAVWLGLRDPGRRNAVRLRGTPEANLLELHENHAGMVEIAGTGQKRGRKGMAANKCLLAQAVRGDVLHRVNAGRFHSLV